MAHRDCFVFSIRNWRRVTSRGLLTTAKRRIWASAAIRRYSIPCRHYRTFVRASQALSTCETQNRSKRAPGLIPVGGVLRNIANSNGLLIGDAAGAVSPLTAGGLDPCMRLSAFAASVVTEYLSTGDVQVLQAYSGELFRSRFASRLWARRIASTLRQPQLLELGCALLRLPVFSRLANHVFFGRGSFPDVKDNLQPRLDVLGI